MSTLDANKIRVTKFCHSVPLPWLYKFGSNVLEDYLCFKGKLPKLIYESNNISARNAKYACCFLLRVEQNLPLLKKVVEKVGLLQYNSHLSASLAYLIVADLLFGKESPRLNRPCKPVLHVLAHQEDLFQAFQELHPTFDKQRNVLYRWVHINKLVTSLQHVKEELQEYGYLQVEYEPKTYEKFLSAVQGLGSGQYLEDFHIKGLLVFLMSSSLSSTKLYKQGKILLQDKASCLPPHVSGVGPGMNVVDACAAPGNKTVLLAGIMKNKGHLTAIERDPDRYAVLQQRLRHFSVRCIRCKCDDFTALPLEDLQGAHTVIVDGPCSNSGVASHTDDYSISAERINNLAVVQAKLLCHALSIPGVQVVIYSTCSIHTRENEDVVCEALEKYGKWFELEDLSKRIVEWKHFGEGDDNEVARKVLRTKPAVDLCHGFFVAKFIARNAAEEGLNFFNDSKKLVETNCNLSMNTSLSTSLKNPPVDNVDELPTFSKNKEFGNVSTRKKRNHSQTREDDEAIVDTETQFSTVECETIKKKRKGNRSQTREDSECMEDTVAHFSIDADPTAKKKRKRETCEDSECMEDTVKHFSIEEGRTAKKKRKGQTREDNECIEYSKTQLLTDEHQVIKKKKKGNHSQKLQDNECMEGTVTHCSTNECGTFKKKKKGNHSQMHEYNKCMEGTVTHDSTNECREAKKKKKVNHSHTHQDNECIRDTRTQSSINECGSLKTKRKDSHSGKNEDTRTQLSTDKRQTIKKKQESDDFQSQEYLECINDIRTCFSTNKYGTVKKNRKGKHYEKDEVINCAEDTETQYSREECGTVKKKRKGNYEKDEDINCTEDTRTQYSREECGTVKKRKGNYEKDEDINCAEDTGTQYSREECGTVKKKRKGNYKNYEVINCTEHTGTQYSREECGTDKKMRKINHSKMNEDIVCINDTRTQISTEEFETAKKKKKGNNSRVLEDDECTIVGTRVLTDKTRNAMKQKKSNSSQHHEDIECVKGTRTLFSAKEWDN